MPTQKQRDANLRNAQFSTGPNSPTGKAASSQNSFKHGVCVSDLNLFNDLETEAGFQGRLTEYLDHHQPATPDEREQSKTSSSPASASAALFAPNPASSTARAPISTIS